eukprot:5297580-Prymnesium_polylepis.1
MANHMANHASMAQPHMRASSCGDARLPHASAPSAQHLAHHSCHTVRAIGTAHGHGGVAVGGTAACVGNTGSTGGVAVVAGGHTRAVQVVRQARWAHRA